MIPLMKILKQYADAKNIPFERKNWESIVRTFIKYNRDAQILN